MSDARSGDKNSVPLKPRGIGRVKSGDNKYDDWTLEVYFDRKPTDDEMRAIHELLAGRGTPSAIAPTEAVWECIDRLEVHGSVLHPAGIAFTIEGMAGRFETARAAIEAALKNAAPAVGEAEAHPRRISEVQDAGPAAASATPNAKQRSEGESLECGICGSPLMNLRFTGNTVFLDCAHVECSTVQANDTVMRINKALAAASHVGQTKDLLRVIDWSMHELQRVGVLRYHEHAKELPNGGWAVYDGGSPIAWDISQEGAVEKAIAKRSATKRPVDG